MIRRLASDADPTRPEKRVLAAASTLRGLPDPPQRIEIQGTGANHVAAAMSPYIVEELEGHPDPVLKITTHPVVIVDTRPHRRSRGSKPPAAMKRERTNDLFSIVRELAGQQARKVVGVIEGRNEGPIRGLAPAEHRLGPPTNMPRQRIVGPLGSM